MRHRWTPLRSDGGVVFQSGMNLGLRGESVPGMPDKGPYRALVVKTVVSDETDNTGDSPVQCDVIFVKSQVFAAGVPVLQRCYGVNDAKDLWIPRPATRTFSGADLRLNGTFSATGEFLGDPTALDDCDGDMVLVDFIEGNRNFPVIIGALPHERSLRSVVSGTGWAEGNNGSERGTPQKEESYSRHGGTEVRINASGDYLVDTVGATSDLVDEVPGTGGQVRFRIKDSQRFTIEIDGVDVLEVFRDGGGGRIDLIEGASQAFIRGTAYTSAEAAFLSALSLVMTAIGAYASSAGPALPAGVLNAAITVFQTALAAFSPGAHLSTRVKGE